MYIQFEDQAVREKVLTEDCFREFSLNLYLYWTCDEAKKREEMNGRGEWICQDFEITLPNSWVCRINTNETTTVNVPFFTKSKSNHSHFSLSSLQVKLINDDFKEMSI